MARLIYVDKLKADFIGKRYGVQAIEYVIDQQPIVDAVEVVRCKDCKFFEDEDEYGNCYCEEWGNITNANGYCHDAERREDV